MATSDGNKLLCSPTTLERSGAGLPEAEVRRFQTILRAQCGRDVALPEAWSHAIELLSLVEMLLELDGKPAPGYLSRAGSRSLALDGFPNLRHR